MTFSLSFLTLYPEAFPGPLNVSILKRARGRGLWSMEVKNIRHASWLPHNAVDEAPAGGGPGLVLRADVMSAALAGVDSTERPIIYPSPRGTPLTQKQLQDLSHLSGIVFICGRFEGVDERFLQAHNVLEVSLGDYILAGGEVAAMAMAEACLRLLPGVAGNARSLCEESFSDGLLEYPQYTKPRDWEGMKTPQILLSGDHEKIAQWRLQQSEALTQARRPDLWAAYKKSKTP